MGYLRRTVAWCLPRGLRRRVIEAMLWPELDAAPRGSMGWLLGIHDRVAWTIDRQCIRWGRGVHIKHELMDGIHSFFYSRVPPGACVLDVGCGNGAVAHSIVMHTDARVVGVDLDKGNIAFARERFRHPALRFELGDVTECLPVEQIDVVVLSSVIEHISDRTGLLSALVERFHPRLFLVRAPTFERHHFVALKRELGLFPYTDAGHRLEYSPESFAAEMGQAGLAVQHIEIRWGDIWAECVPVCAGAGMRADSEIVGAPEGERVSRMSGAAMAERRPEPLQAAEHAWEGQSQAPTGYRESREAS